MFSSEDIDMNKEELLVAAIQSLINMVNETKSYLFFVTISIFVVVIALIIFILSTPNENKEKIGLEILKMLNNLIKFFFKQLDS